MQGEDNGIPAGGTLTNTDSAPPSPRDGTLSEDAVDATTTQRSSQLPLVSVPSDFYAMEQEVGRGGVGVVTKAHDRRLGRSVALKRLQRPEPQARLRFEREMRITAKLQHPGVVPIHEAGVLATGEPFYAMKLVEGRSLKELIGERKSIGERLQLLPNLVAVIETIAYAHSVGIIHRDIKPSNIIVGAYGETVVIDWGLAKDLAVVEDETIKAGPFRTSVSGVMTVTGQIVGTPAYMPPEQAEGADVDRRADVYALGAVLRQLLTGAAPYSGRSSQDVLKAVLAAPPKSLAEVAPDAPKDLAAIANKAMAREASGRYADAAGLLVDLKSFLNGRLVSAYAYAPTERLRKWAAARRGVVATAMIAAVILVGVGAVSMARIIKERDAALESRRATIVQSNALLREQSGRELDQGNVVRAFEILKAYPRESTDWASVHPLVNRIGLAGLPDSWAHSKTDSNSDVRMAINRTGSTIAIASHNGLEIWNTETLYQKETIDIGIASDSDSLVNTIVPIDAGGQSIWLVALRNGDVIVHSTTTGTISRTFRRRPCGEAKIFDTALDQKQTSVAFACSDGQVVALSTIDWDTKPVTTHDGPANAVAFDASGLVQSAGSDGVLATSRSDGSRERLNSLAVGSPLGIVRSQPSCGKSIVTTRDGRAFLLDDSLAIVKEYKIANDYRPYSADIDGVCKLAFLLSTDGSLIVLDLAKQGVLFSGETSMARFYPGRSALLTAPAMGGTLEYWEPLSGWRQAWKSSSGTLWQIDVSRNGVIATFGDVLGVYQPGRVPRTLILSEPTFSLATAGDEASVLLGGTRGGVANYSVETGAISEYGTHHEGIVLTKPAGSSSFYSSGLRDGCIIRWSSHGTESSFVCFPGGLIDASTDGTESIYATTVSGYVVGYPSESQRLVISQHFSGLGRIGIDSHRENVLAATGAGPIHVLDFALEQHSLVDSGYMMGKAVGTSSGQVVAVARDGTIVDMTSSIIETLGGPCVDGSIRVWFASATPLVLAGCGNGQVISWPNVAGLDRIVHSSEIRDVDGSPDGSVIAACSASGSIAVIQRSTGRVWGATTSVPLENLEILASREKLVAVSKDVGVMAIWDLDSISPPYPLDHSQIYDWLHKQKE